MTFSLKKTNSFMKDRWVSLLLSLIVLGAYWSISRVADFQETEAMPLRAVSFEVFGRVQGVFFRKHTQRQATEIGLVGWIRNTARGTVEGELQGDADGVNIMKAWLEQAGSPQSKIDKAVFSKERSVDKLDFTEFEIRKTA